MISAVKAFGEVIEDTVAASAQAAEELSQK